jgi:AcrR family transcriptional regulator
MVRPHRETPIDLAAQIKAVAFRRLAELGSEGLSLRAIARELSITAPAIYNYFPRLEDLITALIVDAFTALGNALAAARDAYPANDHFNRINATGIAYREWACTYPEQYNLIFGTPIPGYHAPEEITQPAAERGLSILIGVLEDAWRAGKIRVDEKLLANQPALAGQIRQWQQYTRPNSQPSSDAFIVLYYMATTIWTRVHGLVSLELYRQYPLTIQPEQIFQRELSRIQAELGLES